MQEDYLNEAPLDATFGEGPQVELGDISDLLKDQSIVDLSWLSEPVTFQHSNSIVPAAEELEYHWGDTTDTLYGAFKLVHGTPPAREQIKKKNLWDHSLEMSDNLYRWAPPSVARVASKDRSVSSLQLFKRLMHRGYTGENLNIEARKYVPESEWEATTPVRSFLASQEGLLGNVFVDVTSFDSCFKAKEVTDKYNKLAKFVMKTSSCGDCSYNVGGRCNLLSKKIASSDSIFTDEVTKQYVDYLVSVKRVDASFISKNASLSNSSKLQKAFLARKQVTQRVAGVKAKLPLEVVKKEFNESSYLKVASKYLAKGYSVDYLRGRFAEKVPHQALSGLFTKAASMMPQVPSSVDSCNSQTLKQANALQRTAKCSGCVYDMSSHCGVSKTAFTEPKVREARNISATFASLPTVDNNQESLIQKTASALNKGHSYGKVLKSASKIVGSNTASKVLDQAMLLVKEASADQFEDCTEPAFKLAKSIKQSSKCGDCSHNTGLGCSLLRKSFVTQEQHNPEATKDHQLYSSFYKDLSLDRMVTVNEAAKQSPLEVEGLNQFNL